VNADAFAGLARSEEVFASTLLAAAIDLFGTEVYDDAGQLRAPGTFALEFQQRLGFPLPEENLGKLIAAFAVVTSDALYRNLRSFLCTVHGLLGDGTDWSYAEPVDTDDLAWALTEAFLLWPPFPEDEESGTFDAETTAWCRALMKREGLLFPPAVLVFAKDENQALAAGQFDDDILLGQTERTEEINALVEQQQQALYAQLASLEIGQVTAEGLADGMRRELASLSDRDKWL
jgi:hypothetical protein